MVSYGRVPGESPSTGTWVRVTLGSYSRGRTEREVRPGGEDPCNRPRRLESPGGRGSPGRVPEETEMNLRQDSLFVGHGYQGKDSRGSGVLHVGWGV